jgi:formiminotetrahydrofolate cyclodeaminase
MVANLTIGKEKYKSVEPEVEQLLSELANLRDELYLLIAADAEAFKPLAAAYGLPSGTFEEKSDRAEVMDPALREAALVPLLIMRKCAEVITAVEGLAQIGSVLAVSDAACAAVLAAAAMRSACLNIRANTKLMKNLPLASEINDEGSALLGEYIARADAVYDSVENDLIC